MKKYFFIGLITVMLFTLVMANSCAYADEKNADSSAALSDSSDSYSSTNIREYQLKKMVISRVLGERNSPLTPNAESFVKAAIKYDIDPYLLPSISWLESSLGKRLIRESNNPFGYGGGLIFWKDFDEGIEVVSKALRNRYYNRGAKTIYDVGRIYAASPTWAIRVEKFMNHFYNEESKLLKIQDIVSDIEES